MNAKAVLQDFAVKGIRKREMNRRMKEKQSAISEHEIDRLFFLGKCMEVTKNESD